MLKKEASAKEELQKKAKNLEDESAKLKKELSSCNQMYEGFKGQYNELEKDVEKLTKELERQKLPEPPNTIKTEPQDDSKTP